MTRREDKTKFLTEVLEIAKKVNGIVIIFPDTENEDPEDAERKAKGELGATLWAKIMTSFQKMHAEPPTQEEQDQYMDLLEDDLITGYTKKHNLEQPTTEEDRQAILELATEEFEKDFAGHYDDAKGLFDKIKEITEKQQAVWKKLIEILKQILAFTPTPVEQVIDEKLTCRAQAVALAKYLNLKEPKTLKDDREIFVAVSEHFSDGRILMLYDEYISLSEKLITPFERELFGNNSEPSSEPK